MAAQTSSTYKGTRERRRNDNYRMMKDLEKLMQQDQQFEQHNELNELKQKLSGKQGQKSFYIWTETTHNLRYKTSGGKCCFLHIIGPPQKDGHDMPLLPYQHLLWKSLQEYKRIWIKKSRGIGCSEFILRYLAYNCVTGIFPPGSRVCIIVGPRIELAQDLINRFKGLFSKVAPKLFDRTASTTAIINGVKVEAFPSHHVDTMRGLTNIKFIMSDESDYYPPFQQRDVRAVMEGYIGKPNSDPHILIVSTPKNPGGLMQQIEQEQNSLYYKIFLDYHYGLEGPQPIYSAELIRQARLSPEFGREYECQYLGVIGNIFNTQSIEDCQRIQYNPDVIVPNTKVSVGIDPSFGSSKFGIVATRFVNERIEVVVAEEHSRPSFAAMIDRVFEIKKQLGGISVIYVDAANPLIWQELKKEWGEPHSDSYVFERLAYYRKHNIDPANGYMKIIPVPFSTHGKAMLQFAKSLVEDPDGLVLIDKRFDKLLTALRTAVAEEYVLRKEDTSYHDVLDAFRLSLNFYKRSK
jgi:hypothetical protein